MPIRPNTTHRARWPRIPSSGGRGLFRLVHLALLQLLVELAGDRAIAVERRRSEERKSGGVDEVSPSGVVEDAGGPLLLIAAPAAVAGEGRDRQPAEEAVPARPGQGCSTFGEPLRVLALVLAVEDRERELPHRVRAKTYGEQAEQDAAERLLRDRVERAVLVRALLAAAQCDVDREDRDHSVEDALRHEAGPAEALDPRALARTVPLLCDRP